MAITKAKVLTVTSVKGGVGKTNFLLNLAGALSLINRKTLIIDLDLTSGTAAMCLNKEITSDIYKLINDFNNNTFTYLEDYVLKYNDNIDILPAPKDPRYASKIDTKYVSVILSKAIMNYDYVLIDTNHHLGDMNLVAMDYSDLLLYVMTSDPTDVKNMTTMMSILKSMDYDKYLVILNKARDKQNNMFTPFDIKNIIKNKIDYIIPSTAYNKKYDKYVMEGKILSLEKKGKSILKVLNEIIDDIEKTKE